MDVPKKYHDLPLQWRTKSLRPTEDIPNSRIIVPLELLVMFLFSELFVYVKHKTTLETRSIYLRKPIGMRNSWKVLS